MIAPNFWGTLIRELRQEKGLSQRQLAAQVHVNRSTLRRIEDGNARGEIDMIERLLAHLGYELEALHRDAIRQQASLQPPESVPAFPSPPTPQVPDDSRKSMIRLIGMSCSIAAQIAWLLPMRPAASAILVFSRFLNC